MNVTIDKEYRDAFYAAAITAALWADLWTDDGMESADEYESIDPSVETNLRWQCDEFIDANIASLIGYAEQGFWADQAGHDFHLTRNHHGAGFWDRGAGPVGDTLTEACRPYGEFSLSIDSEGVVWNL